MVYGDRQYGESRYGILQALTYFRTISEGLEMQSTGRALNLIEKNYSESIGLSEDRIVELASVYSESLEASDNFTRTLDASRTVDESVVLNPVFSSSASLSRIVSESLEMSDPIPEKVISPVYSESIGLSESLLKNIDIIRSEALEMLPESSAKALLERTYSESMAMQESKIFTFLYVYEESLGMKDVEPVRGDTLIRTRSLDVAEALGMSDSQYRIQTVRPVDIPDFTFQALEKYDIYPVTGEPEVEVGLGEPEIEIELIESDDLED